MKKRILMPVVFFLFLTQVWSQYEKNNGIPLVGFDAPSFTAQSTNGEITFPQDFGVVTPANWQPGDDVMIRGLTPSEEESLGKTDSILYQYSWFMTFKRNGF